MLSLMQRNDMRPFDRGLILQGTADGLIHGSRRGSRRVVFRQDAIEVPV